jgi:uncharacterized protein
MKLEQSFEVDAPLERVWQTLIDVEHVAPCLPGAAVTGRNDDGSYNGTFTVKIGPTTASYTGRLEMENIDESLHTATMQAQGTDKRGQGGAKATIFSRLAPADGRGTRVEVVTDYHITGRLARFGRGGMIEDISERLLREFAKRLQSSLAAQAVSAAVAAQPESAAVAAPEPAASAQQEPVAADQATRVTPIQAAPVARDQPTRVAPLQPAAEAAQPVSPAEAAPAGYSEAAPATGYAGEAPGREDDTQVMPSLGAPPPSGGPTGQSAETSTPREPPMSDAGEVTPPAPPPPPSPGPPPVVTPPPPPATPPPPPGAQAGPGLQHPPQPTEPLQGLSLVGGVVWGRVKRNPAPAAAAGVAVMLLLARRRRRRRNVWG